MSLGDEPSLGDELYEHVQRLPKGATFRLHGEFLRHHMRERARKRLQAERGRDFIAFRQVVDPAEEATVRRK